MCRRFREARELLRSTYISGERAHTGEAELISVRSFLKVSEDGSIVLEPLNSEKYFAFYK